MKFLSKLRHFRWRKYAWKCRLRNVVYFRSASICCKIKHLLLYQQALIWNDKKLITNWKRPTWLIILYEYLSPMMDEHSNTLHECGKRDQQNTKQNKKIKWWITHHKYYNRCIKHIHKLVEKLACLQYMIYLQRKVRTKSPGINWNQKKLKMIGIVWYWW